MAENAFSIVTADGAAPRRFLLFLHGILGRGSNWRTVARKVVAARPVWGVALVDLRMHGGSQGFAGPHTVAAAARDLLALDGVLPAPIGGVLGHSFGGKVALEYLRLRPDALDHVMDVDASPSARPLSEDRSSTLEVLELLESLPPRLPSRAALVERAIQAGIGRPLGEWLAMNLESRDGQFALMLDLKAVREMLADYLTVDLWPVVEAVPGRARLDVIIGDRSGVFPPEDRERLARAADAQPTRLFVHTLPTGHWVHAEDPMGLVRILTSVIPAI